MVMLAILTLTTNMSICQYVIYIFFIHFLFIIQQSSYVLLLFYFFHSLCAASVSIMTVACSHAHGPTFWGSCVGTLVSPGPHGGCRGLLVGILRYPPYAPQRPSSDSPLEGALTCRRCHAIPPGVNDSLRMRCHANWRWMATTVSGPCPSGTPRRLHNGLHFRGPFLCAGAWWGAGPFSGGGGAHMGTLGVIRLITDQVPPILL